MMAVSDDLINFDVIEASKENIQELPTGRSVKKLAEALSPSTALTSKSTRPALQSLATPTPADTKNINDCIRVEYESEIDNIAEADDPLDVYDRYVHWILDAYPSAQATPASQLHTVLERATKAFVTAPQYKSDPRYLKLWLLYVSFFADSPRETFLFLARHGIGETLALFYEEYAAWLEGAGRWSQAEEVYKLGIEREARPTARLVRKFGEFEQRRAAQPDGDGPSSPALPTVRPALAAKVDPFAATERDPQAPGQAGGVGGQKPKSSKPKMQIFSDADAAPPSAVGSRGSGSKGWDSIGSLADRKKENMMAPKPWAGETLQTGGKKSSGPKMSVFRDPVSLAFSKVPHHSCVLIEYQD
jgi:checkpoint serine/threonine-protein kinase